MTSLLYEGVIMGFVLSVMTGPIFFTILQISMDYGKKSGIAFTSGLWISDFLFIYILFNSFHYFEQIMRIPDFEFIVGTIGGMILMAVGIGMFLQGLKINKIKAEDSESLTVSKNSYLGHWIKGFLINTINPFTIVFWASIVSTTLGMSQYTWEEVYPFFFGLMSVIVITDIIKVFLSNRIKAFLSDQIISKIRIITGIIVFIFGLVLILRVTF